jgi:N-acetyl-gamma-glutamyl-phosphate reductase
MNGARIAVSVIGATGYSGEELLKILVRHPAVTLERIYAQASAGRRISDILPAFSGILDMSIDRFTTPERSDLFFLALPAGQSMQIVPQLLEAGKRVIDLGGDFRLRDPQVYVRYYGNAHTAQRSISEAIYSIPELHKAELGLHALVANPGCYPTSAILPLAPLLRAGVISGQNIVINSLSGVTGAGKKETQEMSFAEIDSSTKAYRVTEHQHIPEIEQALKLYSGIDVSVMFTPHLIPLRRGIYTTTVADLTGPLTSARIEQIFKEQYGGHYFVRLRGEQVPELNHVVHTNFIDIGWKIDTAKQKIVLLSAIDNLLKGAAGQAVQNMNLLYGLPEETALQ